ncbi:GTP-binding proten HflX [Syntrophobotulus glycolicus DSM 8271]|uniref:GTPase HflX n=1 Tax=Syntrophobotulus glycolicus (strain DSM 8271 / FlGlyR) TaxID=645991 RepID=F0T1R4_SYNGF|nr:GTPase HflX [Syntrophobotulus glycolicus]ADY57488.1 GTP-binding proten HflX [Syntrophobotulus glycolicus DSM 8271]
MRVHGETEGLKSSVLERLDALYDLRIPQNQLWTESLVEEISSVSSGINREIAVYLDRKGNVTDVSIGDHQTVTLTEVAGKRNTRRLTGTRCLHTHPGGSGMLSSVDISSLKILRLDAMIAVSVRDGCPGELFVGVLSPENPDGIELFGPLSPGQTSFAELLESIRHTDDTLRKTLPENLSEAERTVLVGVQTQESRDLNGISEADVSLGELEELAKTAGATVVGKILQKRDSLSSSTIIGRGKLNELRLLAQALEADTVIFDCEISGTQQRNIEQILGIKVLSRPSLILDIFAQRARSREGMLQVELAQMEYRLPRLMGMGLSLSRLGGGIGTRGPGETKLETDRRHIRTRITHLRAQLAGIRKQRGVLRSERQKSGIPVVSIVGYTNAGKSTLLNTLCQTAVFAEDKLFATLDPTTRKLEFSDDRTVLLTDTVGFIRKLPHHLLEAFKSTLEEVVLSDLILIVVDASDPQVEDHIRIVDEILGELGASAKPAIIVLNKIDKLADNPVILSRENRPVIEISARTGLGLDHLKHGIEKILYSNRVRVKLAVPFQDGAVMAWLYANSKVLSATYDENVNIVQAELDKALLKKVSPYRIN